MKPAIEIVPTITWLDLANPAIKTTIVCLLVFIATRLMKHASAKRRHQATTLGLALLIIIPIVGLMVPLWQLAWIPESTSQSPMNAQLSQPAQLAQQRNPHAPSLNQSETNRSSETPSLERGPNQQHALDASAVLPGLRQNSRTPISGTVSEPPSFSKLPDSTFADPNQKTNWNKALALFWMLGSFVFMTRWLLGWYQIKKLHRQSQAILAGTLIQKDLAALQTQFNHHVHVELRQLSGTRIPMVSGLIRPTIYLPASFSSWQPSQQRSVLAHEYGHVVRRDLWTDLLAQIAISIYWWHPLVWLLKRTHETEREKACDEFVVSESIESVDYAQDLVSIVRKTKLECQPAAIAMARTSVLTDRVQNVLNFIPETSRRRKTAFAFTGAIGIISLMVLPFAVSQQRSSFFSLSSLTLDLLANQEEDQKSKSRKALEAKVQQERAKTTAARRQRFEARHGPPVAKRVNAGGIVVDAQGRPVEGVRVLLREHVAKRITEISILEGEQGNNWNLRRNFSFAETRTSKAGKFTFNNVLSPEVIQYKNSPSNWSVVALYKDGTLAAWQPLTSGTEKDLRLEMRQPTSLSGTIVDRQGNGIEGVEVHINEFAELGRPLRFSSSDSRDQIAIGNSDIAPRATSDAKGRFEIRRIPENIRVTLRPAHPDYVMPYSLYAATTDEPQPNLKHPRQSQPETFPVQQGDVTIKLERARRASIKVLGIDEKPLVNTTVFVISPLGGIGEHSTDLDGQTEISDIRTSKIHLWVYAKAKQGNRSHDLMETLEFAEGEFSKEITLKFPSPAMIQGRILSGDQPVSNMDISFVPLSQPMLPNFASIHRGVTKEDGSYELPVPPGLDGYLIPNSASASGMGFHVCTSSEVWRAVHAMAPSRSSKLRLQDLKHAKKIKTPMTRGQATKVDFSVQAEPELSGTVVNEQGHPIPDAIFQLVDSEGRLSVRNFPSSEGLTELIKADKKGKFSGKIPHDSRPTFLVKSPDGKHIGILSWRSIQQTAKDLRLVLQPATTIRGRVMLDGAPLAGQGVRVSISKSQAKKLPNKQHTTLEYEYFFNLPRVETSPTGEYVVANVPAHHEFQLDITRAQGDSFSRTFTSGDPGSQLTVDDLNFYSLNGFVAGRVVDPNGNPVAGAKFMIRDVKTRKGYHRHFTENQDYCSAKDGTFRINYVPKAAAFEISAYLPNESKRRDVYIRFMAKVVAKAGDKNIKIILDPKLRYRPRSLDQ